jgi:hypothetical protein
MFERQGPRRLKYFAYFRIYFFINNKKTTTVNEKRKCHRPPYFNYLSNECLLTAKKRSRTKKSEKNDFAFLFNYKLIIILKKKNMSSTSV